MTAATVPLRTGPASPSRAGHDRGAALIDAGFLFVLCALALLGFQTAYGGAAYLAAGAAAAMAGIVIAAVSVRMGMSILVDAVLGAITFFVLGGAAAGTGAGAQGVVPTVSSLTSLITVVTQGWKVLLTTAPPVGNTGHLLAIPVLLGLVAGVSGFALARRTRLVAAPAIAPAAVLVLGILFGSALPVALLAQGTAFTALVIAWLALRHRRALPPSLTGTRRGARLGPAAAVLAVAAVLASIAGPNLPFAGHERTVLSRYVMPPFDANELASPLGTYRVYAAGSPHTLAPATLFRVSGVAPGALLTLAVMDSYDGLAWGFGGAGVAAAAGAGDVFRRYGSTIPVRVPGSAGQISVNVTRANGLWVPSLGEVSSITFGGPDAATLGQNFVYDDVTENAADTGGLGAGDSFTEDVVVPATPSATELASAAPGTEQLAVTVPPSLQTAATSWTAGATRAWDKVMTIAGRLKSDGQLSDGTEDPPLAAAGHSEGRLTEFVAGDPNVSNPLVGDDEQFAATMALMANAVGVPARVVFGVQVEPGGVVRGKDVHAWVQVSLNGLGWVSVAPDLFRPTHRAQQPVPQPQAQQVQQAVVPPPTITDLKPPPPQPLESSPATVPVTTAVSTGDALPGWLVDLMLYALPPLGLVAALLTAVAAAKASRRRRRRRTGSARRRIAAGWREVLDTALDFGTPLPPRRTRRELALAVTVAGAAELAFGADAAAFAPGEPSTESVDRYWKLVDEACAALRLGAGRRRRLVALVDPRSLRPRRLSS